MAFLQSIDLMKKEYEDLNKRLRQLKKQLAACQQERVIAEAKYHFLEAVGLLLSPEKSRGVHGYLIEGEQLRLAREYREELKAKGLILEDKHIMYQWEMEQPCEEIYILDGPDTRTRIKDLYYRGKLLYDIGILDSHLNLEIQERASIGWKGKYPCWLRFKKHKGDIGLLITAAAWDGILKKRD